MAEPQSTCECPLCGKRFQRRPLKMYCSKTCSRRAISRKRRASWDGRKPTKIPVAVECHACGITVMRAIRQCDSGEYCSRECYSQHRSRLSEERAALKAIAENWQFKQSPIVAEEISALRRIAKRPIVHRLTRRQCSGGCGLLMFGYMEYSRTCKDCRATAKRKQARLAKRTENGRARKRTEKARRRAVERGINADRIDPLRVFERDRWRCHICGRKTPKRLRGSYEPNAPELDHVVPLALGGAHTWGNVRCACRQCNAAKGARALGQLGLNIAA